MINLRKLPIFAMLMILLILISGCNALKGLKGKKGTKTLDEIRTGTAGIVLNFLPNSPPDKIHVEKNENRELEIVLEIRNKGAFPQPDQVRSPLGDIYLSGYDPKIIDFGQNKPANDLSGMSLEGKSTINPNGGLDLATFKGTVKAENLNVEKYEPVLLATACYLYETVAGPSVCIDPDPYSTVNIKKVCQVQSITLTSQGAPIAVTRVDEEAFAKKTQFKISIKNVGGGDVIKVDGAKSKCNPFGEEKLTREDVDKVSVIEVKVGNRPILCGPFTDGNTKGTQGYVRLINNEGFIICELPREEYQDSKTTFTTPLTIKLHYYYRNTAEKKIQIKREISSPDLTSGGEGIEPPFGSP
ncbi:MAG: hypothetical protein AABX33_04535 [Nanoarchaeota archaeon]